MQIEQVLNVRKVGTADNIADIFTKVLDRDPFTRLSRLLLNLVAGCVQFLAPRSRRQSQ